MTPMPAPVSTDPSDMAAARPPTRLFAHWPIRGISDREAG